MPVPLPFFGSQEAVFGWMFGGFIYVLFILICRAYIKDEGLSKGIARVYLIGLFVIPILVIVFGMYFDIAVLVLFVLFMLYILIAWAKEKLDETSISVRMKKLIATAEFRGPKVVEFRCPKCGSKVKYNQRNHSAVARCEYCHHNFPPSEGVVM